MWGFILLGSLLGCGGSSPPVKAPHEKSASSSSTCDPETSLRSLAASDIARAVEGMNGAPAADLLALVNAEASLERVGGGDARTVLHQALAGMATLTKSLAEGEDARWALIDEVRDACTGNREKSKACRETGSIPLAKDFSSLEGLRSALLESARYEVSGADANRRLKLSRELMTRQVKHLTAWDRARSSAKEALRAFVTQYQNRCVDGTLSLTVADRPNMRDLTVIVEAKPSAVVASALRRLGEQGTLQQEFANGLAEGGFGSGFVVVHAASGAPRKFVVTNHHVVGDGNNVHVRVGKTTLDATVIYDDPNYDLAVLEVPSLTVNAGFALAPSPVHDRDEIIATGYPGISGRPSYQTTKGYVSNEKYTPPSDEASSLVYVQHTAPIDPGSSGGPVTNAKNEIVGVNTMKIVGRENVAIAVPGSEVRHALSTAFGRTEARTDRQRALRSACLQFVTHTNALKPFQMKNLIAEDYMARDGVQSVKILQDVDDVWDRAWDAAPLVAMRVAIATRIAVDAKASEAVGLFEDCSGLPGAAELKSRDRIALKFKTLRGERTVVFGWTGERYQVVDYTYGALKK